MPFGSVATAARGEEGDGERRLHSERRSANAHGGHSRPKGRTSGRRMCARTAPRYLMSRCGRVRAAQGRTWASVATFGQRSVRRSGARGGCIAGARPTRHLAPFCGACVAPQAPSLVERGGRTPPIVLDLPSSPTGVTHVARSTGTTGHISPRRSARLRSTVFASRSSGSLHGCD